MTRTENPVFCRVLVEVPTVLIGVGPRKKRRRGETLWPKQTTTGLGPFQFRSLTPKPC